MCTVTNAYVRRLALLDWRLRTTYSFGRRKILANLTIPRSHHGLKRSRTTESTAIGGADPVHVPIYVLGEKREVALAFVSR